MVPVNKELLTGTGLWLETKQEEEEKVVELEAALALKKIVINTN